MLTSIMAGLYGSIHNQVTYTISNEYFTKFKYDLFGLYPEWFGGHRNTVAIIGFSASWWTGLITGTILGIIGLIFPHPKGTYYGIRMSIFITVLVVLVFGFVGFIFGLMAPASENDLANIPKNVLEKEDFSLAGTVHNFSYLGGFCGLIIGGCYQIAQNRKPIRHIPSDL
jgi:hypothetical protein